MSEMKELYVARIEDLEGDLEKRKRQLQRKGAMQRIDGTQRALWVSVLGLRGHYLRPFSRETFSVFKSFSSVRLSASSKGVFLKIQYRFVVL